MSYNDVVRVIVVGHSAINEGKYSVGLFILAKSMQSSQWLLSSDGCRISSKLQEKLFMQYKAAADNRYCKW